MTTPDNDLPKKQRYDYNRADEYLHNILTTINVPDPSAQIYSTKGHLTTGQIDNCVSHVCTQPLSTSEDTDNAWTEADVWAVSLTFVLKINYKANKTKSDIFLVNHLIIKSICLQMDLNGYQQIISFHKNFEMIL